MTAYFIWKRNSNKEKFQFSNTHVFNLSVMEKKGKKKCGFSPHHLLKKQKLNRKLKTQSRIQDYMEVWLGRNVWKIGSLAREKEDKHDNDSKY